MAAQELIPDFLTVEEAAKVLRIGRTAAYGLTQQWRATSGAAGLPVVRFGRQLRVPRAALENFAGCAVVISHDRWFLDRVVTHILAWEGTDENPAQWFWFEGNFESYEKNKVDRMGAEAARPHRTTYRKLTRG